MIEYDPNYPLALFNFSSVVVDENAMVFVGAVWVDCANYRHYDEWHMVNNTTRHIYYILKTIYGGVESIFSLTLSMYFC